MKAAVADIIEHSEAIGGTLRERGVESMTLKSRGMKEPVVQLRMTPEMFEKFRKTFGVGLEMVEAEEQ